MICNRSYLKWLALPVALAALATFPGKATASPLISVGDDISILFHGSANMRIDDNIFLQSRDEESDVIFVFSPGLELNYGSLDTNLFSLYFREDIYRYIDNSRVNHNNSNIFLSSEVATPRLDLGIDASFRQLSQNAPDIFLRGTLVRRDVYRASIQGEYELTERTSIASGVRYQYTDFHTRTSGASPTRFSDSQSVAVPIDAYYELTPRIDVSAGYRYRYNRIDLARNSNDHFFNIGGRGEITPLLTGDLKAGVQTRRFSGGGSSSGFSLISSLLWSVTPKTTASARAFRDFSVGASGTSIWNTGGGLGVSYAFSPLVSANVGADFIRYRYDTGGRDELVTANVGVTYSPYEYVDLSAGYIFRTNDSTRGRDFDSNVFNLSATLRY